MRAAGRLVGQVREHLRSMVKPGITTLEIDRDLVRDLRRGAPPNVEIVEGDVLGVDLLPGALGYDGSRPPDADLASRVLWLDAFTANVDRTWSNPNLLLWHGNLWLIDHGAALYLQHAWDDRSASPTSRSGSAPTTTSSAGSRAT